MEVALEGTVELRKRATVKFFRKDKWLSYPYNIKFSEGNWDEQTIADGSVKVWCVAREDRIFVLASVKNVPITIADFDPNAPMSTTFLLNSIVSVEFAGRVIFSLDGQPGHTFTPTEERRRRSSSTRRRHGSS